MTKRLILIALLGVAIAIGFWLATGSPDSEAGKEHAAGQDFTSPTPTMSTLVTGTAQTGNDGQDHDRLFQRLSDHSGYWSHSLRAQLFRVPPSELLDFFDRDEVLAREDARDVIWSVRDWCILALASTREGNETLSGHASPHSKNQWIAKKIQDSANAGWCSALSAEPDAYTRIEQLVRLADESSGTDHYTRAEQQIGEISDDAGLREFVRGDRMDLLLSALDELHRRRDTSVIRDWSALEQVRPEQARNILQYLGAGLECQYLGSCTTQASPPISALCQRMEINCGFATDFYSIMRRNLSPPEFEALMVLMNGVTAYRHQYGG